MTKLALYQVMENLYSADGESYDEIYHALQVLHNVGLIEEGLIKAAIKKDQELFERGNK